ncbi:MAG: saccharopine dehydrogenase NADP-binding domain-containing protein [Gemmatimonadetes bacterium]|nr:saccharopine dehydrogenase NADP-binding domain-containing protein [Gemmatimonadota bacterium]
MEARRFDVVLYGATGFTGQQAVEYFARRVHPGSLSWAIAGRDAGKLESIRRRLGDHASTVGVIVADSSDQVAVDRMVSRTRVMLSTAGPFALHGGALVDACVRFGTHYVDITGETAWVRGLLEQYHQRAAAAGTRIVPFCGFDSVPSDLGTMVLVRYIQRRLGVSCREVDAYFQLHGGFNGGTVATGFHQAETTGRIGGGDPFLLNPPSPLSRRQILRSRDSGKISFSAEMGTWVGPFVMGSINTRVVRRSAALFAGWQVPYGTSFVYREHQKNDPPLAALKAAIGTAALAGGRIALRLPPTRSLLRRIAPEPGTGPSRRSIEAGWFRCEMIGTAEDGRKAGLTIFHRGDPSNRATVRFVCESALCLAEDGERLPGGLRRGGILTPATAFGDLLVGRLRGPDFQIDAGLLPLPGQSQVGGRGIRRLTRFGAAD